MAPPPPFIVEQWMDKYETQATHNVAETCCASISVDELCELSEDKTIKPTDILKSSMIQNYGEIRGSSALRTNLSRLYSSKVGTPLPPERILITPGAIAANHLTLYALVGPEDHVICHYPTYQQLYQIPESLGAKVDLWKSRVEQNWLPDIEDLKALIKPQTKIIILNNPQNPTGAILPKSLLQQVIEVAESRSIIILSDEVYRPLFHGVTPMDADFPPSMLSMGYVNTIVTGSMSKAYSLAGLRIGWVASRNPELVEKIASARDYTTISVSSLDQSVATFALAPETVHALLARNIAIAKTNKEILDKFITKFDEYCSWVPPVAGTTAFVKFERDGQPIDARVFCERLLQETGILFLPGDGFGEEFQGYVRIGFVNHTSIVREAFEKLKPFMRKQFEDLPLAV